MPKLFIFLVGLWLSQFSDVSRAANPQELTIGISAEFETLNPIVMQSIAADYIVRLVQRPPNAILPGETTWTPLLLARTPTLENGGVKLVGQGDKQKMLVEFEIRPEAVWGDGVPVTGEDVKFSREVALSPKVSVGERGRYEVMERIEVDPKNPKKFIAHYARPRWDYYQLGSFHIVPKHLEEAPFKAHQNELDGYVNFSNYTKNPLNPGLYSGPYRVTEVKLGDHVTVEANPKWWGKPPRIKKIVIKYIPNTVTLEANLRSGVLDMISSTGLSVEQALAFDKRVKSEALPYQVHFTPGMNYDLVVLQMKNPILEDVRVRRALMLAVDRQMINQNFYGGKTRPAHHFVAPADPWFTEDPKIVPIEPPSRRKAEVLLDEAGWKKGPDGYRYRNGQKLSFVLMASSGQRLRELLQVHLQSEWKKIGAEITIKNEIVRTFFAETVQKSKFPAFAMFGMTSAPEFVPRAYLHSRDIPTAENGFSGQNYGGFRNARVDDLIEDLEKNMDRQARLKIIHEIMKIYIQEVPQIPLVYRIETGVTPKSMKGYASSATSFPETLRAEFWEK